MRLAGWIVAAVALAALGAAGWWYAFRAMPGQAEAVVTAARPNAGIWERVAPGVIRLYGPIVPGDEDAFDAVFDADVRVVLLDSGGGDVATALTIGERMRAQGVDVFVTRWCLSSCANYLFLAGRERRIGVRGIVGFHGDFRATIAQMGATYGIPQAEIDADPEGFARTEAEVAALDAREADFLEKVGVTQAFFDMSQRPGKDAGDGADYAFVAPGPAMREAFGMGEVTGEQSEAEHAFLERFGVAILLTE